MAERARRLLDLDEVWLIPAWCPPHKDPEALSAYPQRLAMSRLLAFEAPYLHVNESEKDRGGTSYTVDLIEYMKAQWGEARHFVLLIGGDSLADMASWKDPERLFSSVEVAVFAREGFSADRDRPCRILAGETHPAQSRVIREDIAAGREPSWLTDSVRDYIAKQGLYTGRQGESRKDSS